MKQKEFGFFEARGVLSEVVTGFEEFEEPKIVSVQYVEMCDTWRKACRMAWQMRRIRNMTYTMFAAYTGFTRQHVGDWFNKDDLQTRRSMPVECVSVSEYVFGNKLLSQWIAAQSKLTILEEMQVERALAYA